MVALSSFYPLIQLHLRRNIFSPVSNIFSVSAAILAALDIITTATRRCRAAAPSRDRRHGAGGVIFIPSSLLHQVQTCVVFNVRTSHRYIIFRLLCDASDNLTRVNKDRTICPPSNIADFVSLGVLYFRMCYFVQPTSRSQPCPRPP